MADHTHTRLVEGCYRCDLNRDELRGYLETLVVTRRGVVHDPDCSQVSSVTSTAVPWTVEQHQSRACSRCLPDGIPHLPTTPTTTEEARRG